MSRIQIPLTKLFETFYWWNCNFSFVHKLIKKFTSLSTMQCLDVMLSRILNGYHEHWNNCERIEIVGQHQDVLLYQKLGRRRQCCWIKRGTLPSEEETMGRLEVAFSVNSHICSCFCSPLLTICVSMNFYKKGNTEMIIRLLEKNNAFISFYKINWCSIFYVNLQRLVVAKLLEPLHQGIPSQLPKFSKHIDRSFCFHKKVYFDFLKQN